MLTAAQAAVVEKINNGEKGVYLLHGVTGSGKTEVYMRCISDALKAGKTAIMLVPEISLTPQVLRSFRARFGDEVALLHSGLSVGERFDEWRRLIGGRAKVAVGARSAVFAPLKNVGLIIIDEEHEIRHPRGCGVQGKVQRLLAGARQRNPVDRILLQGYNRRVQAARTPRKSE